MLCEEKNQHYTCVWFGRSRDMGLEIVAIGE